MTEDEAKTKWCPMNRNRVASTNCIGSACMMWKWYTLSSDERLGVQDSDTAETARNLIKQGGCGLAGKP